MSRQRLPWARPVREVMELQIAPNTVSNTRPRP
jgi:hypothetical protein